MLKNRFSQETRHIWDYHIHCMVCGRNQWNALHHIISPSSRYYKPGKHNESAYNSSPVHNYTHPSDIGGKSCHVGRNLLPLIPELLKQTQQALKEMDYEPNDIDIEFLETYKKLYENNNNRKNTK